MQHFQVSDATACGDTVKTLIGTVTTPLEARRIVGVWSTCVGGAALTHTETVSGILELESDDVSLVPCQFPLSVALTVGSGGLGFEPRIIPVNIPMPGQCRVRGYMTMDMALTGANKGRFGLVTE